MWIRPTLNLTISLKWKKRNGDICRGALDTEIGWDWSVGLGAPLGDGHTEKLIFFQFQGFFREKLIVLILGVQMYNKPTKFDENRWSHFWENEILNFFLCELPLILRVNRKRKRKKEKKNKLEIFARGSWISNVNEMDQLV